MILAVDFDETIVICDFPRILSQRKGAKEIINKLYDEGHYIIIWTCRNDLHALDAEIYLLKEGIKYHKFNQHHPALLKQYGNDTRKISADYYIDDKGIAGLPEWEDIYTIIKSKENERSILDGIM